MFLQAGPLNRIKIPKDNDGKQKSFGFAVFKHEESVPYGMNLLNGTSLFGRALKVQFRAGSIHQSPGQSDSGPLNTPNPHGAGPRYDKTPDRMGSPSFSTPQQVNRSFSSPPDSLQRQAMMNNANLWQIQMQAMQQLQQINGGPGGPGLLGGPPLGGPPPQSPLASQQPGSRFGNGGGGSWQDSSPQRSYRQSYQQESSSSGGYGRDQRYPGSSDSAGGPSRHHQRSAHYQHDDRGYDDRGANRSRNHQDRWKEGSRDGRSRRY